MMYTKSTFVSLALYCVALPVSSQPNTTVLPTISDVWVRATVPGGSVTGAYMQIRSATPLKLVKIDSPAARLIELHESKMTDGVMEMKALDGVDIPAGKRVALKPGGMHVMMMKIAKPIVVGDNVPLTLTFIGADKKTFQIKVNAVAKEKDGGARHH